MASNISGKISNNELTDLYNNLEKGSLVKLLIEKHRQLEKQVKNLYLCAVVVCLARTKKECEGFPPNKLQRKWLRLDF